MSRSVNRERMSASKLVSFVIAHHRPSYLFPSKIRNSCHREPRVLFFVFLSSAVCFLGRSRNAATELENLKDAVEGTVGHSVTCADRADPVHPIVLRGSGLEQ